MVEFIKVLLTSNLKIQPSKFDEIIDQIKNDIRLCIVSGEQFTYNEYFHVTLNNNNIDFLNLYIKEKYETKNVVINYDPNLHVWREYKVFDEMIEVFKIKEKQLLEIACIEALDSIKTGKKIDYINFTDSSFGLFDFISRITKRFREKDINIVYDKEKLKWILYEEYEK